MSLTEKGFDESKFYLGKLCIYGHAWRSTGKSLRTFSKWECVECKKERDRAYRQKHKEQVLARKKEYYRQNKEKCQASMKVYYEINKNSIKEYHKVYREHNRQIIRIRQNQWKKDNPDKVKISARRYRINNRVAKNLDWKKYHARKKNVHHYDYSRQQLLERFSQFNNCCAYCQTSLDGNRKNLKQVDRFIAISKGGSNCLGNILPACISCNSSKRDRGPIQWFKSQTFYSVHQLRKILGILGKTEENYQQIPLF